MRNLRTRVAEAAGPVLGAVLAVLAVAALLTACAGDEQAARPAPPPVAAAPDSAAPDPGAPSADAPAPGAPATARIPVALVDGVLPESHPAAVQVPSIGVRSGTLVDLGLTAERELEVPDDASSTGWFELSPTPGEIGPAVIAAHVDYASVPGMFHRLSDVVEGAEITVQRADGVTAVFTVYEVGQYAKSAFPTDRVYGNTDSAEIRLITCGGDFDDGSGEYRDNVVVFARLSGAFRTG